VQVEPRRRDLPVLAGAIGVSALGDWLAQIPLNLELRSMGGSGLTVAALFIAVWSPAAVLAAPAGALADRVDRRRLLVAASVAQAAIAVALAFAGSEAAVLGRPRCSGRSAPSPRRRSSRSSRRSSEPAD